MMTGGVLLMPKQLEQVKNSIVVLRPIYGPWGDSTELWTREGVSVDRRSIRSIKKALARLYAIDLPAQGEQVTALIERQKVLPFYLQPERIFIPLKMRTARCPNDRCCGYVDVNYIENIGGEKNATKLLLKDGRTLDLFCTSSTAAQTICIGQKLSSNLQPQRDPDDDEVLIKAVLLLLQRLKALNDILHNFAD
jgi:hypothetical protein